MFSPPNKIDLTISFETVSFLEEPHRPEVEK